MMKIHYILRLSVILLSLMAVSCEKVIDISLKDSEPILVIEGNIDNRNLEHRVILSETTPFSYSGKRKPVSGAVVLLREDERRITRLMEREAGSYVLKDYKGRPGNTYYLSVTVDGKEYTASSTMPEPVLIDSIGVVEISFLKETGKSVLVNYQDPPQTKNYYRFTTTVNGVDNGAFWIFNDKFTDGKSVTQTLNDFSFDLVTGDAVQIEFQNIDAAVYDYWKGIQDQHPGGTTPANPVSNISNGALGYFSAHSSTRSSFLVE